jgi:Flp pilus assembly pilin Flp
MSGFKPNLRKEISIMFAQFISKFHQEESGQDLVEYALVLIAVAAGVLAGSATLSSDFGVWIANLQTKISSYLT